MRYGRITTIQSVRELHQLMKRRMIAGDDGMDEILDAIWLKLETNFEDPPTPDV
jgi:hypothetical protein